MAQDASVQQKTDQTGGEAGAAHDSVVVAYDGTPSAAAALKWAAREAGARAATLRVVYAADVEGADIGGAAVLARSARTAGVELTDDAASWASKVDGAPRRDMIETEVRLARPAHALVEASHGAGLLVMGSRGRGSFAGAVLGSVAFSVTARAACPVVVVRGEEDRRPGPGRPVVVGVDGSDGAQVAVAFAAQAAARAGAPLVVLAAWTPPEVVAAGNAYGAAHIADLQRWAKDSAQRNADAALAAVRDAQPDLSGDVRVVHERPAQALVEASGEAGLVVVGARGHGAVGGLFLGSVSHAAVHGAQCPVAVVRPADTSR